MYHQNMVMGIRVLLDLVVHPSTEREDQVKGALLLDVVVREGPAILQLLPGKDEPLLVRGNPFLVLDLGFDILDGVAGLYFQGDGLAGESLDKDLHPSTEPEDQVKGALLLDVVVGEGPAILQLLASEDEPLLVRGDSLLVLDFSLDVLNGIRGLHFQSDGLASESLHEDLHPATEPEDQVESALLLDVVVREGPSVLQLLASEDEPLLVRGDSLLVLDLGLH